MKATDIKLDGIQGYLFTSEERLYIYNRFSDLYSILEFIKEKNKLSDVENKMIDEAFKDGENIFNMISKDVEQVVIKFNR